MPVFVFVGFLTAFTSFFASFFTAFTSFFTAFADAVGEAELWMASYGQGERLISSKGKKLPEE